LECPVCQTNSSDNQPFCKACRVYLRTEGGLSDSVYPNRILIAVLVRWISKKSTAWNLFNLITLSPVSDYSENTIVAFTRSEVLLLKIGGLDDSKIVSFLKTEELYTRNNESEDKMERLIPYNVISIIELQPPTFHQPPIASSYYSGRMFITKDNRSKIEFEINQFQWLALKKELDLIPSLSSKVRS
jgi:hypothetical protein